MCVVLVSMSKPLHIAVDLDDVTVDFIGGLVKSVNTEYGTNLSVDDITQWDLHPLLDPIIGRSFWGWLRDREWLWAQFDAVPGAIGAIDKLRREGHYLEAVTSKPAWAEHNVWKWIGLWRPAFQRVTIVTLEDCKADFTVADVLIDDKPQNCLEFAREGREAIMLTRPHNREATTPQRVFRADGWPEVLGIIEGMAARA